MRLAIPTYQRYSSWYQLCWPWRVIALGREGTAVRIAFLRGLGSNPPDKLLMVPSCYEYIPCVYLLHGSWERRVSRCCLVQVVCVSISNTNTKDSSIAFFTDRMEQKRLTCLCKADEHHALLHRPGRGCLFVVVFYTTSTSRLPRPGRKSL